MNTPLASTAPPGTAPEALHATQQLNELANASNAALAGHSGSTEVPTLEAGMTLVNEEEVTTLNLELPLCLIPPAVKDPQQTWTLQIFKAGCLTCDTFNPVGEFDGTQASCHYRLGNNACPGAQVQLVIMGTKIKALQLVTDAQKRAAAGDPMALLGAMATLTTRVGAGKLSQDELTWVLKEAGLAG